MRKIIIVIFCFVLVFFFQIVSFARSSSYVLSSVSWQNNTAPSYWGVSDSIITTSGYFVPTVNFEVSKNIWYASNKSTSTHYAILTFDSLDLTGSVGFEFYYATTSLTSSAQVSIGVSDAIVSQSSVKHTDDMTGQTWYEVLCQIHVENSSDMSSLNLILQCYTNTLIADYNYLQMPISSLTVYYNDTIEDYLGRIEEGQAEIKSTLTDISSKLDLTQEQRNHVDALVSSAAGMADASSVLVGDQSYINELNGKVSELGGLGLGGAVNNSGIGNLFSGMFNILVNRTTITVSGMTVSVFNVLLIITVSFGLVTLLVSYLMRKKE